MPADRGAAARGNIDMVVDVTRNVVVSGSGLLCSLSDSLLRVSGWAIDVTAKGVAGAYILIDGERKLRAMYGFARPDVALSLGGAAYLRCGFEAYIAASSLPSGRHRLGIAIRNLGGAWHEALCGFHLELRRPDEKQISADAVHVDAEITTVEGVATTPAAGETFSFRKDSDLFVRGRLARGAESSGVEAVCLEVDGERCFSAVRIAGDGEFRAHVGGGDLAVGLHTLAVLVRCNGEATFHPAGRRVEFTLYGGHL
jgi:hypothetical protein